MKKKTKKKKTKKKKVVVVGFVGLEEDPMKIGKTR